MNSIPLFLWAVDNEATNIRGSLSRRDIDNPAGLAVLTLSADHGLDFWQVVLNQE